VKDHRHLTYHDVMTMLLLEDEILIGKFSSILAGDDAVFWECKPTSNSRHTSDAFEFVVLPATSLSRRAVDIEPFREKFGEYECRENSVVMFESLRKDAHLVAPCPQSLSLPRFPQYFTHLASFLKHGHDDQIRSLWKTVANTFFNRLAAEKQSDRLLWLSTSGLGVSWLHVRTDIVPKYYNWLEYKHMK